MNEGFKPVHPLLNLLCYITYNLIYLFRSQIPGLKQQRLIETSHRLEFAPIV